MQNRRRSGLGASGEVKSNGTGPSASLPTTRTHSAHRLPLDLVLLEGENAAAFAALIASLELAYGRNGPMALFLIDYAATLIWRLRRVATFEAGLLSWIAEQQRQRHDGRGVTLGTLFVSGDLRALQGGNDAVRKHRQGRLLIGRTLETALAKTDPLGKIGRYESHLMRQLQRTLAELRSTTGIETAGTAPR